MKTITGTIKSTPVKWLPVLSNITPLHIRRMYSLVREWDKCILNSDLPIHIDINTHINHIYQTQANTKTKIS